MPSEPAPITFAEVVHRAVETCDDGSSPALDDLLTRFEDADEPIASISDVDSRLAASLGPLEEDDEPAFTMAWSVIVYLARRRDELDADAAELLRLAARSQFAGAPPPAVSAWLQERGVYA